MSSGRRPTTFRQLVTRSGVLLIAASSRRDAGDDPDSTSNGTSGCPRNCPLATQVGWFDKAHRNVPAFDDGCRLPNCSCQERADPDVKCKRWSITRNRRSCSGSGMEEIAAGVPVRPPVRSSQNDRSMLFGLLEMMDPKHYAISRGCLLAFLGFSTKMIVQKLRSI